MIERIVSGGQTGVDRAALDTALELDFPCGGWCPKGRRAVDGVISDRYPPIETQTTDYHTRTRLNVRDSDATLIINRGALDGGTAYTVRLAEDLAKPFIVVDVANPPDVDEIFSWIQENNVKTLNVAGPREDKRPGIYAQAQCLLKQLLTSVRALEGKEKQIHDSVPKA